MNRKARSVASLPELPRIVLVDANVFFSPRMRDIFMHLHAAEIINIHWTKAIENEWTRNVVIKQGADKTAIQACVQGMRDAAEGWEVAGYEKYIDHFDAVDEKDRHVAAAAHKLSLDEWPGQPVALITRNVKDFPSSAFEGSFVVRFSMANYLDNLFAKTPEEVFKVIEHCHKKLKAPQVSKEEYVTILVRNGCRTMACELAKKWAIECPLIDSAGELNFESEQLAKKIKNK